MFPSNIAGLPTWYTIRASAKGYIGRKKEVDFLVAMNAETAKEDVLTLPPGAAVVYDEPLKLNELRSDLDLLSGPFDKLIAADHARRQAAPPRAQHDLRRRALAAAVDRHGADGEGAAEAAGQEGEGDRAEHERAQGRLRLRRSQPAEAGSRSSSSRWTRRTGMILIEGNAAAAIGCMMAGVTFVGWYPITPSSSLCESLIDYLKKYRKDPETGKATYAVIQAEDEIAALGMVHRRRLDGRAGDDLHRRVPASR